MSTSVEERLRRALARHAETTTTQPDAWGRISTRLDGSGRQLGPGWLRWATLAPVASVAVIALLVVAFLAGRDSDSTIRVTGGAGRLYLVPSGVEGPWRLISADTDPQGGASSSQPPGVFRAFGRRAADGLALAASAVIVVPSDFALASAATEPKPAPWLVMGHDINVATDDRGLQILSWTQPDGRTVGVMAYGLSDAELATLAASLLAGDAARDAPSLPSGFRPVRSGRLPGTLPVTVQSWENDDGDTFMVTVADVPGVTLDDVAWNLPGGRAIKVRDTTGVYSELQEATVMWVERPGTVVSVHGIGVPEPDLLAIAEGLGPVGEAAWRELTGRVPSRPGESGSQESVGSPKRLTADNGFFVIRPVQGRSQPPCGPAPSDPATAAVVPEIRGGQEVACVRLGPPQLAADDVSTGAARAAAPGGPWEVEFTLSREGAARFDALFRTVGPGGEIAVLVDGRIVSIPRVASPSPAAPAPRKGAVTGLDEQTARRLAERLRP